MDKLYDHEIWTSNKKQYYLSAIWLDGKKKKNSGTFFNMEKQKIFRKLFLREPFHFENKKKKKERKSGKHIILTHYKIQSILDHLTRLVEKERRKNF